MRSTRAGRAAAVVLVLIVCLLQACSAGSRPQGIEAAPSTPSQPTPAPPVSSKPADTPSAVPASSKPNGTVIAAAGDISCEPGQPVTPTSCQQKATSDLLVKQPLSAVLALGDEQYVTGSLGSFNSVYGPTWGRVKPITHPVPGDHEDITAGYGFYQYFGTAAGNARHSYYSFDLGAWHIIALDSQCSFAGGCGKGSPEEQWLRADLRAHPNRCTLAYWHQPRFSSGGHGNNTSYDPFWQDLYAAGTDVVLNGHEHHYERFAPQDPYGNADPNGIREFIVGTGGKNLAPFQKIKPNSEVRASTFGVLEMRLKKSSYSWDFVPIAGSTFSDHGATKCH